VASLRVATGSEAAARLAWRPPPRRLDTARVPARARPRNRDPLASLPASLDAAAPTDHEIARAASRASLDPDAAVAAAYSPERFDRIREIRREAETNGVGGVPSLFTESGESHWGMGGLERLFAGDALVPRTV